MTAQPTAVPRRLFLATAGSAGLALSSAGCMAIGSDRDGSGTTTGATETTARSEGSAGPPTGTPSSAEGFGDVPCPSFADADRVVCWHTGPDAPLAIEPDPRVFEPVPGDGSTETITFVLSNELDGPLVFNPYAWGIRRRTDAGWTRVSPAWAVRDVLYELEPGEAYQWVLSRQSHPTPTEPRTVHGTVSIGEGRYAFVLTGRVGASTTPSSASTRTASDGTRSIEWVTVFDVQPAE